MPLPLHTTYNHRILLFITGLFILVMGVAIFAVPPGLDPDPSWGFLVMHCMELGGKFNMLSSPNAANIATNHSEFLAWWSPGQYLVPYFFKSFFKTDTGHAVSITITICNLLGVMGFYKLFTKLGFTKWIAAISVAFISCQLYFVSSFVYYTGGEMLLFAFVGWFLYGCFRFKTISWPLLVYLFAGGLLGFTAKSSVLWMYATAVACVWINISGNQVPLALPTVTKQWLNKQAAITWLKNGLLLAIPFIAALAIIYTCYLSKGANPTSGQGHLLIKPETFGFPLASPMLSTFSFDEIFDGLIYQPDGAKISYPMALLLIAICAACCLAFTIFIKKFSPNKKYSILILSFYTFGCLFFSYMYLKQATISYEGRHFRLLGLLFLPGFVHLLFKTRITQMLFFAVWISYIYMSFNFGKMEFDYNRQASRGASGFSQQQYDNATIKEVARLDSQHHNDAIFVVTTSDIAIEVQHNRVLIIDDETPIAEYTKLRYAGKAGAIFIFTPANYLNNGKLSSIIKSFTGYQHFQTKPLSAKFNIAFAEN